MAAGKINVAVENIFPLIKSFYTVIMKSFYVNLYQTPPMRVQNYNTSVVLANTKAN